MKKVNIVTHRTVYGLQGLNTAYFSDKSRMTLADVLNSIRISKLTVKPSRYRQILNGVGRAIKGAKYADRRFIRGCLDPVFIYKSEVNVKDISGKNPTFEDFIQYIKNLYKIEGDVFTIGLEINGHAVYVDRTFTDLSKKGKKFIIKKGTKMSEIGEFLGFDFNEKVEDTNDPSKQVKVLVGSELNYRAESFLDDLREEISSMVPEDFKAKSGPYRDTIKFPLLSSLLGQSDGHIREKYSWIRNNNPDYIFSIETLAEYLGNLRQSEYINKINEKILPLINKYIKYNDCPLTNFGILKNNPMFKKHYYRHINTLEKAYFLGWIFAEANLDPRPDGQITFRISCDVIDGEIMKRFIESIGLNPGKIKYEKRYSLRDQYGVKKEVKKENGLYYLYGNDGEKIEIEKGKVVVSRMFTLQFKNKAFTDSLKALRLPVGKRFDKIRFPQLRNRELHLAFLLGYFDGDGDVGVYDYYRKVRVRSSSEGFINDIIDIFELERNIKPESYTKKDGSVSKSWRLTLGEVLYDEMMALRLKSLARKRVDPLENLDIYRFRIKVKFTNEDLERFINQDLTYAQIAELHKKFHGIEVTPDAIGYHARNLRNSKLNLL